MGISRNRLRATMRYGGTGAVSLGRKLFIVDPTRSITVEYKRRLLAHEQK